MGSESLQKWTHFFSFFWNRRANRASPKILDISSEKNLLRWHHLARGTVSNVCRQFWLSQLGVGGAGNGTPPPSRGSRPGMLLSTLESTPQPRTTRNYLKRHADSAKAEKLCPKVVMDFQNCSFHKAYQWHSAHKYLNIALAILRASPPPGYLLTEE